MTLDTRIYVLEPLANPYELHEWVNIHLLHAPNAETREVKPGDHPYQHDPSYTATEWEISNRGGQGFAAWFEMTITPEGNAFEYPHKPGDDKYDEDDAEYYEHRREQIGAPVYAELSFDTSYGFKGEFAGLTLGCTSLHAAFIVMLAKQYFEPRNLPFAWKDEYSGEIYKGLDQEGFQKFMGSGADAMSWFENIARPAIVAEAASKGLTVEI